MRFLFQYGATISVILLIIIGLLLTLLLVISDSDKPKAEKYTFIGMGVFLLLVCASFGILFGKSYATNKIQAQTEYTATNIPVTKYYFKGDPEVNGCKVLLKDGKTLTIQDDGTNKISVKQSFKYDKTHVTLTKKVAKNAKYLKKIHADGDVSIEYYVLTIYKPIKGQKNN